MTSRALAQNIEALELAQHAHVDYEVSISAGEDTGWLSVSPGSGYEANILYWWTFGDIVNRAFRLETRHKGYTRGTKVAGPDELQHGSSFWIYATDADPLLMKITNIDIADRVLYGTMWYLNVTSLTRMDIIKVIVWEYVCKGMIPIAYKYHFLQELPNLPNGMLWDLINYYCGDNKISGVLE